MKTLIYILFFIWQLPQNLVALIMMPFIFIDKKIADRHYTKCYVGNGMNGGISLGNFAFVSRNLEIRQYHVSHEVDGHTVQSKILGPLYLIVIGIPSICWATFRRYNMKRFPNYYTFYTEKWANHCAKLEAYKRPDGVYDLRPRQEK